MLPALAHNVIATYSDPGDLVVDPKCGAGTALVEAIRLDRDALGVARSAQDVEVATASLNEARSKGAPGRARVLAGNGRDLVRILSRREARAVREQHGGPVARLPHGSADLILTTVPPGGATALEPFLTPANAVVKPGGFVVLVITASRAGTVLAGEVVELGQSIGLLYWQHVVALIAEIRGDQLVHECGSRAHKRGRGRQLTCHEDVLVFRRPTEEAKP
jgi:SAM-dependent methyltransferase